MAAMDGLLAKAAMGAVDAVQVLDEMAATLLDGLGQLAQPVPSRPQPVCMWGPQERGLPTTCVEEVVPLIEEGHLSMYSTADGSVRSRSSSLAVSDDTSQTSLREEPDCSCIAGAASAPPATLESDALSLDANWLALLRAVEEPCELAGSEFLDPDFPPEIALFSSGGASGSRPPRCRVECWRRPCGISRRDGSFVGGSGFALGLCEGPQGSSDTPWQLFRSVLRADDVVQGELGDCWLLSALAALAEARGGALARALLPAQEQPSNSGAYIVRLCIGGRWRGVVLDDRLPCLGGGGYHTQLVFCVTRRSQLWASMVEKAVAKVCGGYEALCGGESGDALTMLTGWPCDIVRLREGDDPEEVWVSLIAAQEAGSLMTCSTKDSKSPWLMANHVYSLLGACELLENGRAVRLVRIRNPNTRVVWSGSWSERSALWTPCLREQASQLGPRQDSFFMSLEDFAEHFAHFTVCRLRGEQWHEQRRPLRLPGAAAVPCCSLSLEVGSQGVDCVLGLAQPEGRVRGGPLYPSLGKALACIGFVLLSAPDGAQSSGASNSQQEAAAGPGTSELQGWQVAAVAGLRCRASSWADCHVAAGGRYLLVPLALQASEDPDVQAAVACFGSAEVSLGHPLPLSWEATRAAWAAYARTSDSEPVEFHGALLYMGKAEGGALVALAENRGVGHFFVDLSLESDSLRFSRGEGATSDWLPAGFGQILQVALPSLSSGGSAGWASSHRFLMTSRGPAGQHHLPALDEGAETGISGTLHAPFRLETF